MSLQSLPENTDTFVERMVRKFVLSGVFFLGDEPTLKEWARNRWSPGMVLEEVPSDNPALVFLNVATTSPSSTYADSDILDRIETLKEKMPRGLLEKSVILILGWDLLSSGGGDFPNKEEVEEVLPVGRRNYTVAGGAILLSEPLTRPNATVQRPPKIKISSRYVEEEEVRTDDSPYEAYLACLEKVVDFKRISSFVDVGCATGNLIKLIKRKHKNVGVMGLEFFQFHKENADPSIQEDILIHDLRDPLHDKQTIWDVVNCTEVGEHIDPAYCDQFLENIKTLCGYRSSLQAPTRTAVFLSWAEGGGVGDPEHDPRVQHLNPLTREQVEAMMTSKSFRRLDQASDEFLAESERHERFLPWWRKSFGIWVPTWHKASFG